MGEITSSLIDETTGALTGPLTDSLVGGTRSAFKAARKSALLDQENNLKDYKKKLSSYTARMGASGGGSFNSGVEAGLAEDVTLANQAIADNFNWRLKNSQLNRKKNIVQPFVKEGLKFVSGQFKSLLPKPPSDTDETLGSASSSTSGKSSKSSTK